MFLEQAKEANADEFKELADLGNRFETLMTENTRLKKEQQKKDEELESVLNEIEKQKKLQMNEKI